MTFGSVKTAAIAFFALFLGASHVACACFSHAAPQSHQPHFSHMGGPHNGGAHDAPDAPHDHHGPGGDRSVTELGSGGCEHCAKSAVFHGLSNIEFAASLSAKPTAKTVASLSAAIVAPSGFAHRLALPSLWRGPPDQTPVTLKIRLLN